MLLSIILTLRAADRAALRCFPICVAAVSCCIRTGAKLQGTMQLDKAADALHSITSWAVVEKGACQQQQQQSAVSSQRWGIQHSAINSGAISTQQWGIQQWCIQQWGIQQWGIQQCGLEQSTVGHPAFSISAVGH